MLYNDTSIRFFDEKTYLKYLDRDEKKWWRPYEFLYNYHSKYYNYDVYLGKIDIEKYNSQFVDTIKDGALVYFDKSSKVPRSKIQSTTFKRTIKPDRADYLVVNNRGYVVPFTDTFVVFEDSYDYGDGITYNATSLEYVAITEEEFKKYFNSNMNTMMDKCATPLHLKKIVYTGPITAYLCPKQDLNIVLGIYNKPIVVDDVMDKYLSSHLQDLTIESAVSIAEMLNSPDSALWDLGVRLLGTYNIQKYRLSSRLILLSNTNWFSRKNVFSKFFCDTLNLSCAYSSVYFLRHNWLTLWEPNQKYEKEDIELTKQIALNTKCIKDLLDKFKFISNDNDYYKECLMCEWIPDEYRI